MIQTLTRLLHDPRTERFVIALIVLNAVTLGLETSPTVMARIGPALHVLDTVILSVFVAELAARLFVQRLAFFRDGWNVFDFVVVGISLVPSTDTLSVLRSLRILRALRLVTAVPSLKRVVGALIAALPGMGSITLLLALIFYVGAVMATKLFGVCPPGVEGEACKAEHFETLGASIISLFQGMTLDALVASEVEEALTAGVEMSPRAVERCLEGMARQWLREHDEPSEDSESESRIRAMLASW